MAGGTRSRDRVSASSGRSRSIGDDGPIALGGQKQRALLALLLLHAGEVVSSDALVDAALGRDAAPDGVTSLQNFVSQLRKAARGGRARHAGRPATCCASSRTGSTSSGSSARCAEAREAAPRERAPTRCARRSTLWRGTAARRLRLRDVRRRPRSARLEELRLARSRSGSTPSSSSGGHADLVARARGARRAAPAARAAARPADARALPRRAARRRRSRRTRHARRALVDELGIEPGPALQQLNTRSCARRPRSRRRRSDAPPEDQLAEVVKALLAGGSSRCSARTCGGPLPDAIDVAARLAEHFDVPGGGGRGSPGSPSTRPLTQGVGPLYDELHALFDREPRSRRRPPLLRRAAAAPARARARRTS